jgi:acyl-CoA reductase-like NAD-dependent aldehyde dehydrogenase
MATDRIIIHAAIAPAFIAALKDSLKSNSDPANPPPTLVSAASKDRVRALISEALSSGANIIHGSFDSESAQGPNQETSVRMAPIILGDASERMQVWQDESFASLAACMIVNDDDEAVRIANKGGYGLSAAVFTEDLRKGLALAKKIESG